MKSRSPRLNRNDLRTYPVQEKPCKTCPFAGKTPLPLSESDFARAITKTCSVMVSIFAIALIIRKFVGAVEIYNSNGFVRSLRGGTPSECLIHQQMKRSTKLSGGALL